MYAVLNTSAKILVPSMETKINYINFHVSHSDVIYVIKVKTQKITKFILTIKVLRISVVGVVVVVFVVQRRMYQNVFFLTTMRERMVRYG